MFFCCGTLQYKSGVYATPLGWRIGHSCQLLRVDYVELTLQSSIRLSPGANGHCTPSEEASWELIFSDCSTGLHCASRELFGPVGWLLLLYCRCTLSSSYNVQANLQRIPLSQGEPTPSPAISLLSVGLSYLGGSYLSRGLITERGLLRNAPLQVVGAHPPSHFFGSLLVHISDAGIREC